MNSPEILSKVKQSDKGWTYAYDVLKITRDNDPYRDREQSIVKLVKRKNGLTFEEFAEMVYLDDRLIKWCTTFDDLSAYDNDGKRLRVNDEQPRVSEDEYMKMCGLKDKSEIFCMIEDYAGRLSKIFITKQRWEKYYKNR